MLAISPLLFAPMKRPAPGPLILILIIKRAARVPSNPFLIHSLQVNVFDIAESHHTKVVDVMTPGRQG
jgi:hypothetical protein